MAGGHHLHLTAPENVVERLGPWLQATGGGGGGGGEGGGGGIRCEVANELWK